MLTFYRKTYKRAPKDATQLNAFEIGIVYPAEHPSPNGHGEADGERPEALPEQPAGPMASATESPGEGGATAPEAATDGRRAPPATDDEKARTPRRVAGAGRAHGAAVARGQDARRDSARSRCRRRSPRPGLEIPEWLRTGASAPGRRAGRRRATSSPRRPAPIRESERKPELDAQKAEAAAEGRDLVGGAAGRRHAAGRAADGGGREARIGRLGRSEGGQAGRGAAQAGDHAEAAVRAEAAGREARDQPRGRHARGRASSRSEHEDRARRRRRAGRAGHRRRHGRAPGPHGQGGHRPVRLRLVGARQHERRLPHLRRRADREPGGRGGRHHAQAGRQGPPAHQRPQGRRRPGPRRPGRGADPVRLARQPALRQGAVRQHDRAGPAAAPGAHRVRRGRHPRVAAAPLRRREPRRHPLRLRPDR